MRHRNDTGNIAVAPGELVKIRAQHPNYNIAFLNLEYLALIVQGTKDNQTNTAYLHLDPFTNLATTIHNLAAYLGNVNLIHIICNEKIKSYGYAFAKQFVKANSNLEKNFRFSTTPLHALIKPRSTPNKIPSTNTNSVHQIALENYEIETYSSDFKTQFFKVSSGSDNYIAALVDTNTLGAKSIVFGAAAGKFALERQKTRILAQYLARNSPNKSACIELFDNDPRSLWNEAFISHITFEQYNTVKTTLGLLKKDNRFDAVVEAFNTIENSRQYLQWISQAQRVARPAIPDINSESKLAGKAKELHIDQISSSVRSSATSNRPFKPHSEILRRSAAISRQTSSLKPTDMELVDLTDGRPTRQNMASRVAPTQEIVEISTFHNVLDGLIEDLESGSDSKYKELNKVKNAEAVDRLVDNLRPFFEYAATCMDDALLRKIIVPDEIIAALCNSATNILATAKNLTKTTKLELEGLLKNDLMGKLGLKLCPQKQP